MDDDKFVKIPLRAKVIRVLALIGTALIIIVLGYTVLRFFLQKNVVVKEPESISVMMDENDTLEAAGEVWMEVYLEQHRQRYIKYTMAIEDFSINKTQVLENGINKAIQIDFTVHPKTKYTSYFLTWGDFDKKEKTIDCQWVIIMTTVRHENGKTEFCCYKKQTLSNYKFEMINAVNRGDLFSVPATDTPINSKNNSYIIKGNKLSVSFNGGITWVVVPLSLESLLDSNEKNSGENSIQKGSYTIEPKMTAFVFGGTEKTKLSFVYSHDGGVKWTTSMIDDEIKNVRLKLCRFVNENTGYVVIAFDKNKSGEKQTVYKTSDGGETWEKIGSGPSTMELTDCLFLDDGQGFFCYDYVAGKKNSFYYTNDDCSNFEAIPLPINKDINAVFNRPQAIYSEGNLLFLKIAQDENSNYLAGKVKALYVSEDNGRSWRFVGVVDD